MRLKLAIVVMGLMPFYLKAQVGANGAFSILKTPMHSRALAWGGYMSSQSSPDLLQATSNPALLRAGHHLNSAFSTGSILPQVKSANMAIAYQLGSHGDDVISRNKPVIGLVAQYLNYGDMDAYDEGGNPTGTVSANESNIAVIYAQPLAERIFFGAQLGMAYSVLGPYVSNGVYMNYGLTWVNKDSAITQSVVAKNLGFQVVGYRGAGRENLGGNLEYSICLKPKHMPFRFHFTAHNLQRWDLTYNQYQNSTGKIDLNGNDVIATEAKFADKLARHLAIGTEMALGQNFSILFGYNHQRRKEMYNDVARGTAGFGWGVKFRVLRCDVTYSSASYFPTVNSNTFSIILNTQRFVKKGNIRL